MEKGGRGGRGSDSAAKQNDSSTTLLACEVALCVVAALGPLPLSLLPLSPCLYFNLYPLLVSLFFYTFDLPKIHCLQASHDSTRSGWAKEQKYLSRKKERETERMCCLCKEAGCNNNNGLDWHLTPRL